MAHNSRLGQTVLSVQISVSIGQGSTLSVIFPHRLAILWIY